MIIIKKRRDTNLDAQAQYSYRASGEGSVADEGHLYISNLADGFQIMHEFAHAFADSSKPKGMDVVEWSAELNRKAGLPKSSGAYFGSNSDAREAERFADAIGHALTTGGTEKLKFVANVSNIVKGREDSLEMDTPENISDGTKKTLDFSQEKVTITSKELSQDGAPKGNKNAEGPHRRNHLSEADKRSYTKRIVGKTTSDGITITGFSDHAYDRVAQRNVSKSQIEQMIHSENIVPDKQFPDRNCYDIKGKRLVLNKKTGEIVTVEKRRQNK